VHKNELYRPPRSRGTFLFVWCITGRDHWLKERDEHKNSGRVLKCKDSVAVKTESAVTWSLGLGPCAHTMHGAWSESLRLMGTRVVG
jgi:hypothetical protein